jgi:translation initiation factor IF-3
VKLTCVFKSREIEHPELGKEKIQLFLDSIADHGQSEGEPTLLGKLMSIMVNPKK